MNIFNVLSEGKSRLHEPSISAMLGYLLDTTKDHGLGDRFLREFLILIEKQSSSTVLKEIINLPFIKTDIELESAYELAGKRCDIDIEVSFISHPNVRIFIENKIRHGSAKQNQLCEYYNAIISESDPNDSVFIVFITPEENKKHYQDQYNQLTVRNNHSKSWLHWRSNEDGILNLFESILKKDAIGEINPINEYLRHTIKAFISHVRSRLLKELPAQRYQGEDIGQIVDEVYCKTNDGYEYKIVLRDSTQIQIFRDNEKMIAKEVLRKIIREKSLDVPTENINTRVMGRKVILALKNANDV